MTKGGRIMGRRLWAALAISVPQPSLGLHSPLFPTLGFTASVPGVQVGKKCLVCTW